jgi:hypothetical protein
VEPVLDGKVKLHAMEGKMHLVIDAYGETIKKHQEDAQYLEL